jgi:hypothetical protein
MQHVEGSGTAVLYIGRTVLKDQFSITLIVGGCSDSYKILIVFAGLFTITKGKYYSNT